MLRILATTLVAIHLVMTPAWANDQTKELSRALGIPEMVTIMRQEGLSSADELFSSIAGGVGDDITNHVQEIYAETNMLTLIHDGMTRVLGDDDASVLIAFYSAELGKRIVQLELSAREAFLDPDIELASEEIAANLNETDPRRHELLTQFIEVNNLVDANVIGALNSNFAFYQGMDEVGGFAEGLSEREILNEIWSQEPEIRQDTTKWLYSFLGLAYQPLSNEELELYIDFSGTPAGLLLTKVLFAGFDDMFLAQSKAMGRLFGTVSKSEEL